MGRGLGHLHHRRVEVRALQVEGLLPGRQAGRQVVGHVAEAGLQVPGQPVTPVHVAQARALEGGDDVVGVGHDQIPGLAAAWRAEHDLREDRGPQGHGQVPQPHAASPVDAGQGVGRMPADQVGHPVGRQGQHAAGRAGHLVVAGPGLEVLLVDLGSGRQPVPEQVGQRRAPAAAVGGRMAVDLPEPGGVDQRAGHGDALVAVDAGEQPHSQRHDPRRQPGEHHHRGERGRGESDERPYAAAHQSPAAAARASAIRASTRPQNPSGSLRWG